MESKYVPGSPTIARFDFSRLKFGLDKTENGINKAALYLWNLGRGDHGTQEVPVLFTSLTKKQKLDIVGAHVEQMLMDLISTQVITEGQTIANSTSKADVEANY